MKSLVTNWSKLIKQKHWQIDDFSSQYSIKHLNRLISNILPNTTTEKQDLSWGNHFLFNNQLNQDLGSDGYDNYQAPRDPLTGSQLFSRRMWARGDIEFYQPHVVNKFINCHENIKSVRMIGDSVFVNIIREISENSNLILNESRSLVYTNNQYEINSSANSAISQITEKESLVDTYDYCEKITLNPMQILQYSVLTNNLHKIHYDKQYCMSEGLPDIIAPGPLIIIIVLNWFNAIFPHHRLKKFSYKIINPILVNQIYYLGLTIEGNNFRLNVLNINNRICFTGLLYPS